MKRLLILGLFCILSVYVAKVDAQVIEPVSYADLLKDSDVVCIAGFDSTQVIDEKIDDPGFKDNDPTDYFARCTKFKIAAALKGELDGDSLELVHYHYASKAKRPEDGPKFVDFAKPNPMWEEFTLKAPKNIGYLLFLKKRSDGKYIPTAGQKDILLSIRRVENAE